MPVSILIPAYNEEESIGSVVRSLLAARFPEYEIIVINDGSTDGMLDSLKREFALIPAGEAQFRSFRTQPIRGIYRSTLHPRLRVIDKENGGKGDALNAGLDEARYPMILAGDGDSLYAADVLEKMIQPFLEDSKTVGCGAALRVLNEAAIIDGVPIVKGLSSNYMVRFQILEYLRAGLNSRFGWGALNGMASVSGACALWRKNVLVAAGGYRTNTVWEDTEVTVRVHHYMRALGVPYRIAFVPEAVCWTRVPETLGELARQRISWQRHITEAMSMHRNLVFARRSGLFGWFAMPAMILTELLAPIWLFAGLLFVFATAWLGILSVQAQLALLAIVFSFTLLKVAFSFVLDEVSYRTHTLSEVWLLFWAAFWEQIGYRQLIAIFSLIGTVQFFAGSPIRGQRQGVPKWSDPPYRPKPRP
jgi:cellulose synthase/poly-beta-1,6-N-acetylglucosamine synthase-like glycosyltransferase